MARTRWLSSRRVVLGGALALAGMLAPTPASAATGSYVALGDSYTAGPLIPNQLLDPIGCLRSDHNYPHLVSPSLGLSSFRDASCSGAKTDHMTAAQNVTFGPNPPQFDRLSSDTKVVTLGIGGNDIGFTDIVTNCATLNPFGRPCKNDYVVNGVDSISQAIAATGTKVATVLQGIHTRSPGAKVFVVGYPAILPDTGFGCWPVMPLTFVDVPYLRTKEKELNSMLSTRAAANGAIYVDTYAPSIGHDSCKGSGTKWVEPIVPTNAAAPVHPNALGMQGIANVVRTKILAAGVPA